MALYCLGCGAAVEGRPDACPHCATPLRGKRPFERVRVFRDQVARELPDCCCCLNPASIFEKKLVRGQDYAGSNFKVEVRIPWCRACRFRQRAFLFVLAAGGGMGIYAVLGFNRFVMHSDQSSVLIWMAYGIGAAIGLSVVRYLLPKFFPPFRFRGHVQFCDAYSDEADVEGILQEVDAATSEPIDRKRAHASIYFRNRAFAQRWRDLNKPVQGEKQ